MDDLGVVGEDLDLGGGQRRRVAVDGLVAGLQETAPAMQAGDMKVTGITRGQDDEGHQVVS